MHTVFPLQHAKGKFPFELQGDLFDAGYVAFLQVEFLDLEVGVVTIHPVHAHQHGRPIAAFRAASAGGNLHDGIEVVFLGAEHVFEFQFFHRHGCRVEGLLCLGIFSLSGLHELKKDLRIVHGGQTGIETLRPRLQRSQALHDQFGLLGIVPKLRILRALLLLGNLNALGIDGQVPFQVFNARAQCIQLINRNHTPQR